LIWRQVGNRFGDFFDFHVGQFSTSSVQRRKEIERFRLLRLGLSSLRLGRLSRRIRRFPGAFARWSTMANLTLAAIGVFNVPIAPPCGGHRISARYRAVRCAATSVSFCQS
jgi:hypothetical protein